MPISGHLKFGLREPFYMYSLVAEITHNGKFEEYVVIDEKEITSNIRPYLPLIWLILL